MAYKGSIQLERVVALQPVSTVARPSMEEVVRDAQREVVNTYDSIAQKSALQFKYGAGLSDNALQDLRGLYAGGGGVGLRTSAGVRLKPSIPSRTAVAAAKVEALSSGVVQKLTPVQGGPFRWANMPMIDCMSDGFVTLF